MLEYLRTHFKFFKIDGSILNLLSNSDFLLCHLLRSNFNVLQISCEVRPDKVSHTKMGNQCENREALTKELPRACFLHFLGQKVQNGVNFFKKIISHHNYPLRSFSLVHF